jgi:hypothetical protein
LRCCLAGVAGTGRWHGEYGVSRREIVGTGRSDHGCGAGIPGVDFGSFHGNTPPLPSYLDNLNSYFGQGICIDFALRSSRADAAALDPQFAALRSSRKFRGFLAALATATLCIFVRSVYRVVELSEGWTGHLIRQQWLFVGLEGVMVVIAVAALNAFHPAFCFDGKFEEEENREGAESKGMETENSV